MGSSTLYPPPSAFMNGQLSNRASAILNAANPSCNSLNLLELDELLGWAESAKSTPHQSAALDELDKLLGEFNIETVDRLEKRIAEVRPQLNRASSFHTSEGDIRSHVQNKVAMTLESRVFSEPRFETCNPEPDLTPVRPISPPLNNTSTPMDDILKKEYPPEILHNFFGRRNITDTQSEMSSVVARNTLSHTPSVCSSVSRYSQSFSSSEKASNYTMFSLPHRREVYNQVPSMGTINPKFSTLLSQNTRYDVNTLSSNASKRNNTGTLKSNASTLRANGHGGQPLKATRKKRRCKFLLCTPV